MPHFDKHFTLAEANALIPRIREIFTQINALIEQSYGGLESPFPHPEQLTPGRTNGGQKKQKRSREAILREINDRIAEIADQGIVIQDVYRGLVDFPAFVNGDEVFLCYELNDGDFISFFHAIDAGYAGRKPIPEDLM